MSSYVSNMGTAITIWAVGKLYRRPKFSKFLILEDIKHDLLQAAKRKEERFPDLLISFLSAAFSIPEKVFQNVRWDLLFGLFGIVLSRSAPKSSLPLVRPTKSRVNDDKREPWDYNGRSYALYMHILAKAYGWSLKYIGQLDIDVALALVQEILTDEQLDREFLWAMSDKSYIYNVKTKSGKPNPLERPYFMREEVKPPQKTKIPVSLMPMGVVRYDTISAEFRPSAPINQAETLKSSANVESV